MQLLIIRWPVKGRESPVSLSEYGQDERQNLKTWVNYNFIRGDISLPIKKVPENGTPSNCLEILLVF
jgi:hypothetical protein